MNRSIAIMLLFLGCTIRISAQLSEGGLPASMSIPGLKSTTSLPRYKLKQFNKQALTEQDSQHPIPFRYAVFEDVNIDLKREGHKDLLPDNSGTIWRLKIESDSAFSIQLILSKFFIPFGAKLFVYNENLSQIAGAFTCNNMQSDSTFVIADIIGNKAIIEYFEPAVADFAGKVVIGSVGKAYKDIFSLTSESDYIGVNCPEGKDLQDIKHAVCKITFRSDSGSFLCTGALLNNARNDETPYFLTASHCISKSLEASTLVAYFNYERADCDGKVLNGKTLSGSTLLTNSPSSDYTLLRLNQKPTAAYQPYYAGWNAENQVFDHVSGVHHPEGLTKKLAIDNDTITTNTSTIQWQETTTPSPVASHWQVNFDIGRTAGGSSGSPLFNKKKQVIGQLHGGDDVYDLYGKFSYSWTHPLSKYKRLSFYLDPDTTGITSLGGHYPSTNAPDAFIAIPFALVCVQAPVKLTDYSVFGPFTRNWTISPSTYSFVSGTSTSANPVVQFLEAGKYSVKLEVFNANGRDSMKLTDAFQAGTTINVGVNSLPSGESCLCTFDHFIVFGNGATNYSWEVLPGSEDKISLDKNTGDTVTVSLFPGFKPDSSLTVNLKMTGSQGTCSDSSTLAYDLILQANDSLKNARLIPYGKTPVYSNKCATVEPGEPQPPAYSCTTQYSWCDEYGTGKNIVEHSVWFKFVAAPEGHISVSSSGFDNELALYDASSYTDILNHNYTILAANDDRSTTDSNPLLKSVPVTPGKTYWIQADGSGGGSEGNFYLLLTALVATNVPGTKDNEFVVYPQPASDIVYVKADALRSAAVHLSVYSLVGDLVEDEMQTPSDGILTLDTKAWEKGLYILKIGSGTEEFVTRIIKY